MDQVQDNETADSRQDDPNAGVSGDELYRLMGFDTIDSVSNNVYLAPAIGGGPTVPAYRIVLKFSDTDSKTVERVLPLDELLTIAASLLDCFEVKTLKSSVKSIALLNMREKKRPIATIERAILRLQDLKQFLEDTSVNNFEETVMDGESENG